TDGMRMRRPSAQQRNPEATHLSHRKDSREAKRRSYCNCHCRAGAYRLLLFHVPKNAAALAERLRSTERPTGVCAELPQEQGRWNQWWHDARIPASRGQAWPAWREVESL